MSEFLRHQTSSYPIHYPTYHRQSPSNKADQSLRRFFRRTGLLRGEPIPMDGDLLKDKDGNIVVTRLDEGTLRKIAEVGNGAYVHAGNEEFGLNPIINDINKLEEEHFKSTVFEEYDEQYMYFFAIALVLFIIEMLIGERRWKRRLFE